MDPILPDEIQFKITQTIIEYSCWGGSIYQKYHHNGWDNIIQQNKTVGYNLNKDKSLFLVLPYFLIAKISSNPWNL